MREKTALFSVSDLSDIERFAEVLVSSGWRIIATSVAYQRLKESKIPVESVESFTEITKDYGFPPTLHPRMEYALTSDKSEDKIELVYDIPYTLETGNDVGGLTLLALACKGERIPVLTKEDMEKVINAIGENNRVPPELKDYLIAKTNFYITQHYLTLVKNSRIESFDGFSGIEYFKLLNGENPYQIPSNLFVNPLSMGDALGIHKFRKVSGDAPCFTNVADLDCILITLCKLTQAFKRNFGRVPFISIAAKHGNPCGLGIDWESPDITIEKALWGNPVSIWGGEFITNFMITQEQAELLFKSPNREKEYGNASWMLDIVAAPGFSDKAVEILGNRPQRKLLENPALAESFLPESKWDYRQIRGGFIRQPISDYIIDLKETNWIGEELNSQGIDSLLIAWAVSYASNHGGNEVAVAKNRQLIGVGGGPSTVDAVTIALARARNNNHEIKESIFAADAFFPYLDAPEILINAGCRGGIVPYGGKKVEEAIDFFKDKGIILGFIPENYRGFCRH